MLMCVMNGKTNDISYAYEGTMQLLMKYNRECIYDDNIETMYNEFTRDNLTTKCNVLSTLIDGVLENNKKEGLDPLDLIGNFQFELYFKYSQEWRKRCEKIDCLKR